MSNETITEVKNNNYNVKRDNNKDYSSSGDYSINSESNSSTSNKTEEYDVSYSSDNSIIEYLNISDYTNGSDFTPNLVLEKYKIYSVNGIYESISDWWENIISKFGRKSKEVEALEILAKNGIMLDDISQIRNVRKNTDGSMCIYLENDCNIITTSYDTISFITTPEANYYYKFNLLESIYFKNGLNIKYQNEKIRDTNYYSDFNYNSSTINYRNRTDFSPINVLINNNIYSNSSITENISDWWSNVISKFGIDSIEIKAIEKLKNSGVYTLDVNKNLNIDVKAMQEKIPN